MSTRANYLPIVELNLLDDASRRVADAFGGEPPFLVGSCTQRPDYRDVDVRMILTDDEFDALYGERPELWELTCLSVSVYLNRVTGLPVDFQVQRMTQANEEFGGLLRHPLGMPGVRYAGGPPTP